MENICNKSQLTLLEGTVNTRYSLRHISDFHIWKLWLKVCWFRQRLRKLLAGKAISSDITTCSLSPPRHGLWRPKDTSTAPSGPNAEVEYETEMQSILLYFSSNGWYTACPLDKQRDTKIFFCMYGSASPKNCIPLGVQSNKQVLGIKSIKDSLCGAPRI